MQRTLVIGDLHGCHKPFVRLLNKIKANPEQDEFVFLGDYVNRGPHSKELIEELLCLKEKKFRTIFLKGNHEVMLLNYLRGRGKELFLRSGGQQTISSYGADLDDHRSLVKALPKNHRQFLDQLLPYWEDENFIYVHAGLEPGIHLSQQSQQWLYWADKQTFLSSTFQLPKRIIFGHFAQEKPLFMIDKIGIDCGAVYGGMLTCLVLPEMRLLQVTSPTYWPLS
ncbi:MAG: metallophosphoesterase family protein [Thermodesulfobacteriota bacterium]